MKKIYSIVFLLSLSFISLELVWTRIFSAEYFYTFAFLILSIAILGLGLGALSLRLFKFLNDEKVVGWILITAAVLALAGPIAVIKLKLDFSILASDLKMILKFVLAIFLLGSSFYLGGIALAFYFRRYSGKMPMIYAADLTGAGLGVIAVILVMNYFSTPSAVFLTPVPVLIAAFLIRNKWMKIISAALFVAAVSITLNAEALLDSGKEERAPVVYSHWDAMSKIKIYEYSENYRGINIDNAANSPVYKFDGDWNKPDSLKFGFSIDVSYLINKFNFASFLSLGAGGGTDVLQALQNNAAEVYAVEVNPHINFLMEEGELAEFSGAIYSDPRVNVITEDARSFIRRYENEFDIIYSLSSNSFAALASGSFALAENYLFTTEAFKDYWKALSDNGFMMMEHQFYMPRLVSEFIGAMEELGVENYKEHFAVYNIPQMRRKIILISKKPLNEEILTNAFGEVPKEQHNYKYILYPPHDSVKNNLINKIVEQGWEEVSDEANIDISPATDNKPFTAQLGLWKNFEPEKLKGIKPYEFFGFPVSKLIMLVILAIVLVFIIPLNLIPYFKKGDKLKAAPWLYFFSIGMAFMFVEVVLMQRYALFIGPSVYSVAATLLSLLMGSGVGSYFSGKFSAKTVFVGIIGMLLVTIFVFPILLSYLEFLEMLPRILVSLLLILPLGFFMGMPFPKAAVKVGELIDWGFAVNGAASVFGSVLVVYLAFSFGFNFSLIIAAVLYGVSWFLLENFNTST